MPANRPATLVILNPVSGGGRAARRWPRLRDALYGAGLDFDVHTTSAPGDATLATRRALRSGYERVVVAGGDGTVNEAVNGFFADDAPLNPSAVLGVVSCGTGGDFRRTLGLSRAVDEVARMLVAGSTRRVDIGRVDFDSRQAARYFINVADCGLGGEVAALVNESGAKAPGIRGTAVFLSIALRAHARYRAGEVRLTVDGETLDTAALSVVVANGRYFGGGMRIAPQARLDDGMLDLVVIPEMSTARTLVSVPALYRGTHLGIPGVATRTARSVRIESLDATPLRFDIEGEQIGASPATVTCLPRAIRVCAPGGGELTDAAG